MVLEKRLSLQAIRRQAQQRSRCLRETSQRTSFSLAIEGGKSRQRADEDT